MSFELSTRMKAVQRSQGDSATARAAYRACCVIECEREGRTHDYSRKGGQEASEIVLPEDAPAWAKDRGQTLERRRAEGAEQGQAGKNAEAFKANAQTARDVMFTYPAELSKEGRLNAARIIARHLVSTSAVAVDFNIHEPGKDGDENNYHCHMHVHDTAHDGQRASEKNRREWDEPKTRAEAPKDLRKFIADTLNAELAAEGKADLVKVEYLSFKERGISQKPTSGTGTGENAHAAKATGGIAQGLGAGAAAGAAERHGKEQASLKLRQDFDLQRKLAELEQRAKEGREAIDRDLQAASAKPIFRRPDSAACSRSSPGRTCGKPSTGSTAKRSGSRRRSRNAPTSQPKFRPSATPIFAARRRTGKSWPSATAARTGS